MGRRKAPSLEIDLEPLKPKRKYTKRKKGQTLKQALKLAGAVRGDLQLEEIRLLRQRVADLKTTTADLLKKNKSLHGHIDEVNQEARTLTTKLHNLRNACVQQTAYLVAMKADALRNQNATVAFALTHIIDLTDKQIDISQLSAPLPEASKVE